MPSRASCRFKSERARTASDHAARRVRPSRVAPKCCTALKKALSSFTAANLTAYSPCLRSCAICEIKRVQIEALLSGLRQKGLWARHASWSSRNVFDGLPGGHKAGLSPIKILRLAFESARRRPDRAPILFPCSDTPALARTDEAL